MNFNLIMEQFNVGGKLLGYELYGYGHINDTYKVTMEDNNKRIYYIVQRINNNIFKDIEGLMQNIVNVTNHIKNKKINDGGDIQDVLYVIPSVKGKNYVELNDNFYRCYNFISKGISIETTATPRQLFISGVGYGRFQNYLSDFPANTLIESIPNFHNTKDRYDKFLIAIHKNTSGRLCNISEEVNFIMSRASYASKIVDLMDNGLIPYRVTHNDTKLNNILIDIVNEKAIAAIDLDTVMPGSILYDFGDSIRSGAKVGAEDEQDLDKIQFSLELFTAFSNGFISEVKNILTIHEVENMAFGAILMTYECGMRFLTDYLDGDIYFKVKRENHNLDRARTQMRLVSQMEKVKNDMDLIIRNICRSNS